MSFSGSTFGRYMKLYLIIFGAIFLVAGIVVIVALGNLPYAGGAMLLMGGIFAVLGGAVMLVGFLVGRSAAATDELLATGTAGTATIAGVAQTGMYLNDQPQIKLDLLVQLPGHAPYAAEHSEFVPLILLARVQPGATLPVRVNPADPQKVAVDWQAGSSMAMPPMAAQPAVAGPTAGSGMDESLAQVQAALAGTGAAAAPAFASPTQAGYTIEQLRAWLRANGLEAQARVDFLEDTGKIVGDERLYTMEMTLLVPGSAPEKLDRSAAMVPVAVMSRLQQGMTLPVKVAAANHHLLTVEWERI